jgi:cellobiose phosphorylase
MDKVGNEGRGESVWLGFFLFDVLTRFMELSGLKKDLDFTTSCLKESVTLKKNLDAKAWDGEWYLRAFFDDGTPLGSSSGQECKIDSLPQSWSVLSRGGDVNKSRLAIRAADERLVKKEQSVIRLFDPPFDHALPNPGYIKGYLPGVRENGGQYTHAAIWLVMAMAAQGNSQRVYELIQMINPLLHGSTPESMKKYKTEPYVIAADVYAVENHEGMGGWTWYTGSAGWMYQLLSESFFGLKRTGNKLALAPCIPDAWENWDIHYRFAETDYHLLFERNKTENQIQMNLDGVDQENAEILLLNDQVKHVVRIKVPLQVKLQPENKS